MRGKRSKQYRKLMNQYALIFGFREPYQVLLDENIVIDAAKFKMDLLHGLERTLHGNVKPMITTCTMRQLYQTSDQDLIAKARAFERRRCNHHTLEQPLSTRECWQSVIDPKISNTNKHRYVVAVQDREIRSWLRTVLGVPLIYVHRSVMILEPMAEASEKQRSREEREKFRAGVSTRPAPSSLGKRKRVGDAGENDSGRPQLAARLAAASPDHEKQGLGHEQQKRRRKGPREPNPLSMKRSTKKEANPTSSSETTSSIRNVISDQTSDQPNGTENATNGSSRKRKRKPSARKPGDEILDKG